MPTYTFTGPKVKATRKGECPTCGMCARSASVVRLPVGNVRGCVMCEGSPSWEVNRKRRSCDRCLADALADFYETTWDGFIPAVVSPLRTGGAA